MRDENELIYSPLQRHYTEGEVTVEICIYRTPGTSWTLEVVDGHGNSTVWEDEFETDQAAFDEAMQTIRTDGIASLIGEPSRAAETERAVANPLRLATPLSTAEMDELDAFLSSDATSDETMMLDQLDGYLTAIVIGPTTLSMNQWYPGIWGKCDEDAPHFNDIAEAQRIMEMIMRHYNGIIWSLQHDAESHEPIFDVFASEEGAIECIDGEMWAAGFMEGVALSHADWRPLFEDPRGSEWIEPIRLLGDEDMSEVERAQTATPRQREAITKRIPASVAAIHRFWLPHRHAMHEVQSAKSFRRQHPKVGRNDPCPCGSGKKYKKCCGLGTTLH